MTITWVCARCAKTQPEGLPTPCPNCGSNAFSNTLSLKVDHTKTILLPWPMPKENR